MVFEKLHEAIRNFNKAFNWRQFRRDALHLGESLLVFGVLYGIDSFACHNCGTWIENWNKVEEDSGGCRRNAGWYVPKRCPECGAKIISHKSCAFCRWHLQDGTCFNKLEKRSTTGPEDSCWIWEERE